MAEKLDVPAQRPATDESISEFMRGKANMPGGRIDTETRGISSEEPRQFEVDDPRVTVLDENSNTYVQEQPGVEQPNEPNYRQMYGESENQKGEWRRTAEANRQTAEQAMAQAQALQVQLEVLRNSQTPGATGYPSAPVPPAQPQRFLDNKEDEDIVYAQDVERLVQEKIAPAMQQLNYQTQQLAQAQVMTLKQSAGITPVIEQQLTMTNPWLNGVPDGPQKVEAMRGLLANQQRQQQQPQRVQTPQVQTTPVREAARRVTYVEPGRPSPTDEHPSAEQLFDKEMEEAMREPWGEARRAAMQKVFRKYGVDNVNDFTGSGILTR
jgi:hypothetical protein